MIETSIDSRSIQYKQWIEKLSTDLEKHRLIGGSLFTLSKDENFKQFIHNLAMAKLMRLNDEDAQIFVQYEVLISLSLIALEHYDGDLWTYIEKTYDDLYERFDQSRQRIARIIRLCLSRYDNERITEKRKINIVISQSFVPLPFLDDFYNLILDTTGDNFIASLPDDDSEVIGLLSTIFGGVSLASDSKDEKIVNNKTNQTYRLIQSTQDLISSPKHFSEFLKFSTLILRSIERILVATHLVEEETFFDSYAKDWFQRIGQKRLVLFKATTPGQTRFRWKPEFSLENRMLFLNTPTHLISKTVNPQDICLTLISHGKVVFSQCPQAYDTGFYYEIPSIRIKVDVDPFTLTYQIGPQAIKTIDLSIPHLLFDAHGKELKINNDFFEEITVVVPTLKNSNVTFLYRQPPLYEVGVIQGAEFSILHLSHTSISLRAAKEPHLVGTKLESCYIDLQGRMFDFYTQAMRFVVPDTNSFNGCLVKLNLRIIPYSEMKRENDFLHIELNRGLQLGMNKLELVGRDGNSLINPLIFGYDPDLFVIPSVEADGTIRVKVNSNLVLVNSANEKGPVFTYQPSQAEEFSLSFEQLGSRWNVFFFLPIPMFKKENQSFQLMPTYFWRWDYSYYDKIEIKGINAERVEIIPLNGFSPALTFYSQLNFRQLRFIFDMGDLRELHEEHYKMVFKTKEKTVFEFFYFSSNYAVREEHYVHYKEADDTLTIHGVVLGKNPFKLQIQNDSKQETVYSLQSGEFTIHHHGLQGFQYYYVNLIQEQSNRLFWTHRLYVINKVGLVGKTLEIKEANVSIGKGRDFRNISTPIYNSFIVINDFDEEEQKYTGKIFYWANYERVFFHNIIEITLEAGDSINSKEHIVFYINDFDGDAMLVDLLSHHLVDDLDDYTKSPINFAYLSLVE